MSELLDKAKKVSEEERENAYKRGDECFQRIADYWNIYLSHITGDACGIVLSDEDVAYMMVLNKMARQEMGYKEDNLVDMVGYINRAWHMGEKTHAELNPVHIPEVVAEVVNQTKEDMEKLSKVIRNVPLTPLRVTQTGIEPVDITIDTEAKDVPS